MARKVLRFSVRTDAVIPLEEMKERLEAAMGCTFREGEFHKVPALVSELLGMKISLFEWRGIGGAATFRLSGRIDDPRFTLGPEGLDGPIIEIVGIPVDEAIIDLLDVRGAGAWRIPSRDEIEAELDFGDSLGRF